MRSFGEFIKRQLGNLSCIDVIWYKTRQFRLLQSGKGNLDNEISPKDTLSFNYRRDIITQYPYLLNPKKTNPILEFVKSFVSITNGCKLLE